MSHVCACCLQRSLADAEEELERQRRDMAASFSAKAAETEAKAAQAVEEAKHVSEMHTRADRM